MGSGASSEVSTAEMTVASLVKTVHTKEPGDEQRGKALARLLKLSEISDEYKIGIANPDLGLVKLLGPMLEAGSGGDERLSAYRIVWYLSREGIVLGILADPSNGLLPPLVKTMGSEYDEDKAKQISINPIGNISLNVTTHAALLSPELNFLETTMHAYKRSNLEDFKAKIVKTHTNLVKTIKITTIKELLAKKVPEFIIGIFREGKSNPSTWSPNAYQTWAIIL